MIGRSRTTATACEFTVLLGYANSSHASRLRATVRVAALAAALGYLALVVSRLVVIRDFGLLLAATVALSLLAAHVVVRVWPPRDEQPVAESAPVEELEGAGTQSMIHQGPAGLPANGGRA